MKRAMTTHFRPATKLDLTVTLHTPINPAHFYPKKKPRTVFRDQHGKIIQLSIKSDSRLLYGALSALDNAHVRTQFEEGRLRTSVVMMGREIGQLCHTVASKTKSAKKTELTTTARLLSGSDAWEKMLEVEKAAEEKAKEGERKKAEAARKKAETAQKKAEKEREKWRKLMQGKQRGKRRKKLRGRSRSRNLTIQPLPVLQQNKFRHWSTLDSQFSIAKFRTILP
ncbi:hypothetical protein BT69DRAFT_1292360 [Atractiella rhizophila]|nr:hypothetical protein BT69DRAFT_1292360 [Atractiella rhizophila]